MQSMEKVEAQAGQWPRVASVWKQLGPPLRPSQEDLAHFRRALSGWCARHAGKDPRGLILGVTPELYHLPWPDRARLMAADRTPEMVAHVWPGDAANVQLADWRELDLPQASLDIVMCDGGLHLLDYPAGQARLFEGLSRLLAPGGLFVIRLFVPPPVRETPPQVQAALLAGEIPDLNCLKLRLGMALQQGAAEGVALGTVWRTLRQVSQDWAELAERLGWPLAHLQVIDAYRDSAAHYHFVTVEEAVALAAGNGFELQEIDTPSYRMGGQCPTLAFRRLDARAA